MTEQLFQIGIKALIRNSAGEIYMLHMPANKINPDHWDLPGGRMDPGETFLETLKRELIEEIGMPYIGQPKQLMGMLTGMKILVKDELIPLVFIVYEVEVASPDKIKISDKAMWEDKDGWFAPKEAAKLMETKFSPELCKIISNL